MAGSGGALQGLRVVDMSATLASAFASMIFADNGAEVIQIEPPGGSRLRSKAGWPIWSRGKKSVVLDLHVAADVAVAQSLLLDADVAFDAFRPGVADRFGIGYDSVAVENPRLVYVSITGFGRHGRYAHLKGYDPIVQAKIGGMGKPPSGRSGPAMPRHAGSVFGAGLLAMHGSLIALYEREDSGLGQRVDATLLQGIAGQDPWAWILRWLAQKYPEAFIESESGLDRSGVPTTWLGFSVMAAPSKDGRWLQFAHANPRQFEAFVKAIGLGWIREDPEWKDAPDSPDSAKREQFWDWAIEAVRSKTVAEWYELFDRNNLLFAELFRSGTEPLDHPQMVHDHHTLEITHPGLGVVREPNVLVQLSGTPGSAEGCLPGLDEHGEEIRARGRTFRRTDRSPTATTGPPRPAGRPPLEGVTVLDFGTYYAAPFATAMLADQGARVIHIESLDGDPMRYIQPMPEAGGVRMTQGKESIAIDINTDEGRQIVYELGSRADIVLQSYRGGVAERLGFDHEKLLELNPDLIYHYGQGYGVTGPYANRPAYAPVIAAGSGFARRNLPGVPEGPDLPLEVIKHWAVKNRVLAAGNCDGFAAYGVSVGMALGLYAQARGHGGQWTLTSMLSTLSHVLSDEQIEFEARPDLPRVDDDDFGYNATCRLYETLEGWLVLCVIDEDEWQSLTDVLRPMVALLSDDRFCTASARATHEVELVETLQRVFSTRSAADWEKLLTAADVAGVEVIQEAVHAVLMDKGGLFEELGMTTTVEHPLFGEHVRARALVTFSRSGEDLRPGCLVGQHTDAILKELGYGDDLIVDLRARQIVGG